MASCAARTRPAARAAEPAGGIVAAILVAVEQLRALQRQASGLGSDILTSSSSCCRTMAWFSNCSRRCVVEGSLSRPCCVCSMARSAVTRGRTTRCSRRGLRISPTFGTGSCLRSSGQVRRQAGLARRHRAAGRGSDSERISGARSIRIIGIVDRRGSAASHAALLARSEGIPMLVAAGSGGKRQRRMPVLLDAENGELVIDPVRRPAAASVATSRLPPRRRRGSGAGDDAGGEAVELQLNGQFARCARGRARRAISRASASCVPNCSSGCTGIARCGAAGASLPAAVRLGGRAARHSRLLDAGGDKPVAGLTPVAGGSPARAARGC